MFFDETTGGAGGAAPEGTEPTLDQQLEALKPTGHESAPAKGSEPSEAPKPEAATPGSDASQTPAETPNPVLEKLDQIMDKPAEQPKPELSQEQQQILNAVPNIQTAQQLYQTAQGYHAFTDAFERGDFNSVEQMFQNWNPGAFEAFLEHVYAKKVANGEWVDRWITEQDVEKNPALRGIQQLQNKITQLENALRNRSNNEQSQQQHANLQRITQAYVGHLDSLFNQIDFSAADRRWVMADINNRVSVDNRVRQAIQSGNIAAVNGIFKQAVRDYVNRDKQATMAQNAKLAQQEQKKPPIQSGQATQETALPENIKDVPKGQEEAWMDQELAKLGAKKR